MSTVAEIAAEIIYKPGWTFEVGERNGQPWLLVRSARVPDADNPSRMLTLPGGRRITPEIEALGDIDKAWWVLGLVDEMECHETGEFFRWRGVKIADPHRGSA